MTYAQIVKAISTADLPIEQLRSLNILVIGSIKAKKSTSDRSTKALLRVGMKVGIDHKKCRNTDFVITKINSTKIVAVDDAGNSYNVPVSMLIF